MAEHGKEFEVLYGIIKGMVNAYNTEMRKDIIREKAIRISADVREDKSSLIVTADHIKHLLASVKADIQMIKELLTTSQDHKTQTWGKTTLETLAFTDAYLSEYLIACNQAIDADPQSDLSDLFEQADNMRDAFEEQYETFVQVTGIK